MIRILGRQPVARGSIGLTRRNPTEQVTQITTLQLPLNLNAV